MIYPPYASDSTKYMFDWLYQRVQQVTVTDLTALISRIKYTGYDTMVRYTLGILSGGIQVVYGYRT